VSPADGSGAAGDWLVLSALVPPAGQELLMVDALRRMGARAVAREGQRVVAWVPAPDDVDAYVRDVAAALRASTSMTDPGLVWSGQSHQEWAARWMQPVQARRVSERIVVAPAGGEAWHGDGDVVVRLEAGVGFGTAEHATTRGCLRLLAGLIQAGDRVADIGTGSGILAVAAALLGARHVLAFEADPLACAGARRNAEVNGVADRVEVRERVVRAGDLQGLPPFDLILANLEGGVIAALLPDLAHALTARGALIVSGVTGGERPGVVAAAAAAGLEVHVQEELEGWWSAALRRGVQASASAGGDRSV